MKKILYVILDGLGDEPHPDLGHKTPLEAANTPNLDSLARRGRNGVVVTVGEGIAPESDIAVFSILGYDPHTQHAGRGPLEALGAGMEAGAAGAHHRYRSGQLFRLSTAKCLERRTASVYRRERNAASAISQSPSR